MTGPPEVTAAMQRILTGIFEHGALCRAALVVVRAGVAVPPAHLEAILAQGAQFGDDLERLRLIAAEIEMKGQGPIGRA